MKGGFKAEPGAPALNTVLHRVSVLSKAHQMRDVSNLTRDPAVQDLLRRIRRAYAARGALPGRKPALTRDPLEALLATCCTDGLIGARGGTATVFIENSQEDQEGQGWVKALSAGTTQRLRHWPSIAGLTEGPLFRSTPRSKQPYRFATPLSDGDVARIY